MRADDPQLGLALTPAEVTPLVLAAGASSRMGCPKAALRYGEESALERILRVCAGAGLGEARVVVGAHPEATRAAAEGRAARFLDNPDWEQGRTSSLQRGLRDLSGGGALLWPVDACLATPATLAALLESCEGSSGALAWVPSHAGRRGHPVLLAEAVFARFLALGPDQPAREVIRALASEGALCHVEVEDPAVLMNANTPAELARWGGRLPE